MYPFEVSRYTIRVKRPEAGCGCVKAAFLTDLHSCRWGSRYELLLNAIDREAPDIILVGGDMITAVPGETTELAEELMADLAAVYPVYYGVGNHEYRLRLYPETYGDLCKHYFAALRDCGVVFLPDRRAERIVNGVRLCITGYNIPRRFYRRFRKETLLPEDIAAAVGKPDPSAVNILLAHNPKYMESYLDWGADLTLCGHNHGGIARLPGGIGVIDPDLNIISKRSKGRFGKDGRTCIVSAGLGEHSVKLRINNPRELVLLNIISR